MKAHTKRRCLCPKPDYILREAAPPIILKKINAHGLAVTPLGENILHFKVATIECSRCGVPLCEDCKGIPNEGEVLWGYFADDLRTLYPVCAEEMR